MQINKICKHCGANITADQESMTDAMQEHRDGHVKDLREQIETLEKRIEEIESDKGE